MKKRRKALSCSQKTIYIIKRNNIKPSWWFLLLELSSFWTENKLKSHEKVWKNKDSCGIVTTSEKDNILVFKQYMN